MGPPLVTVCVPVYNHELFVGDTIKSLIAQDYQNIELIIIDDGSKDESANRIQSFSEECEKRFARFSFIHRENRGLCNTINQALDWAQGEYFATVASDDQWLPHKISLQVDYLEATPTAAGVFGGIDYIDNEGNYLRRKTQHYTRYKFDSIFTSKYFLPAPTQLIRTKCIREQGGYDPEVGIEDLYMWLKITENGCMTLDFLNSVVARYRRHSSSLSRDSNFMRDERKKILAAYAGKPLYSKAVKCGELCDIQGLVINDKFSAFKRLLSLTSLWSEPRFWKYLVCLFVPRVILKRYI